MHNPTGTPFVLPKATRDRSAALRNQFSALRDSSASLRCSSAGPRKSSAGLRCSSSGLRNSSVGPRCSIAGLTSLFAATGNAARSAPTSWKRRSWRPQHV
jgi:hypothetical protein